MTHLDHTNTEISLWTEVIWLTASQMHEPKCAKYPIWRIGAWLARA